MPDPRTFEARLRRALIRYTQRCPDDVDALALAREIVASSSPAGRPATLPRRLSGRSRDPDHAERFTSMTNTLKLAAVVAALAAVGWAVIGGTGPRQGPSQAGAPSPSPSSMAGADWAFFTGTMQFDGSGVFSTSSFVDNGMTVDLGMNYGAGTMVTDDPRMTGVRNDVTNLFSNRADNATANIGSSLMTIENDGGGWTCPMTFLHYVTDQTPAGEIEQWAGWCEGTGGYAGLKAYLAMRQPEDPASSFRQDIYGFITSADGPPMPEAPAS